MSLLGNLRDLLGDLPDGGDRCPPPETRWRDTECGPAAPTRVAPTPPPDSSQEPSRSET
ncbi:hypothetical protein Acsp06_44550 [Actinomycetospora sp. NBRC 106375]|nr:hypothetical protein Acsp06_44550 [Actinomycetospora sp. NBRC 106375]